MPSKPPRRRPAVLLSAPPRPRPAPCSAWPLPPPPPPPEIEQLAAIARELGRPDL